MKKQLTKKEVLVIFLCCVVAAVMGGLIMSIAEGSEIRKSGATSQSIYVVIEDANGDPNTSAAVTDLDVYYTPHQGARSSKVDLTALAAADSAYSVNKGYHVGGGLFRIDVNDAAFSGSVCVTFEVDDGGTSNRTAFLTIDLSPPVDSVAISGDATTADNFQSGTANWLEIYSTNFATSYDADQNRWAVDVNTVRGATPLDLGSIADEVQVHMDANSAHLPLLSNGTYGLSAIKGFVDDIGVAGVGLTALPELVWEDPNAASASNIAEVVWEDPNAVPVATINLIVADTNELQTDWTNGGRLDTILDGVSTTYLLDTTVASSSTASRFTLTAGKQSTNAFLNHIIAVTDGDDSNVEERVIIGYTSGRVVTVDRPFSFTPAATDVARISLGGYTFPKKGVR